MARCRARRDHRARRQRAQGPASACAHGPSSSKPRARCVAPLVENLRPRGWTTSSPCRTTSRQAGGHGAQGQAAGRRFPTAGKSTDVEAYNLFLQGRYFAQRQSPEDSKRAIPYLQRSLDRDPSYAPAWVELANVNMTQADYGWFSAEAYSRAREAVHQALVLDPNLASRIPHWAGFRAASIGTGRQLRRACGKLWRSNPATRKC